MDALAIPQAISPIRTQNLKFYISSPLHQQMHALPQSFAFNMTAMTQNLLPSGFLPAIILFLLLIYLT
jgi:hypothetical protein